MTNEEAIERLKVHHMWTGEPQEIIDIRKENKALEMAIKALSQEPCDDVVSRQAVLNAIEHEDKWLLASKGHNGLTEIAFSGLKARVDALPPVTQKSGKWILLDECSNSGYYCSNCQKKLVKEGWSQTVKKIKFCPNCGAIMEIDANE